MADTIVEALEQDVQSAFKDFAAKPTQSGRIRLRDKLRVIADALEVESYGMDDEAAVLLRVGIGDLRSIADAALVAPVDALLLDTDTATPQKPVPAPRPKTRGVGKRLMAELQFLFLPKKRSRR